MDQSRRNTLKALGAAGAGIVSGGLVNLSTARAAQHDIATTITTGPRLNVQLQHSWAGEDATIIIRNSSGTTATISEISPSHLSAEPGMFDFTAVTKNGPVTLAADQEIHIPLTPMGTPASASNIGHFDRSLQKRLRESLVIKSNDLTLVQTTTTLNPQIV